MLDEVEQALVGPVDVLQRYHQRALCRQTREELMPGGERSETPGREIQRVEPEQHPQLRLDEVPLLRDGFLDCLPELPPGARRGIGVEDPGDRLHDLGERPVGDPVTVGDRAPLQPPHVLRSAHHLAQQT